MNRADDFPAAHSMDTEWFAVDRDGHVAFFRSGEEGAVPDDAFQANGYELARIAGALSGVSPLFDLKEWVKSGAGTRGRHLKRPGRDDVIYEVIMFLERLGPISELLGPELVAAPPSPFGAAVVLDELSASLYRRIHNEGVCRGCFSLFEEGYWASRVGVFEYVHISEEEGGVASSYCQNEKPALPIRAEMLPDELRKGVEQVRFDSLCFGEDSEIQPMECFDCSAWVNAYVDLEGVVRAIPGHENEFREEFEGLVELYPDLIVEPPPD